VKLSLDEVRRLGQGDPHLLMDPWYGKQVMRRASPFCTYLVVTRTALSADAITGFSISMGVVAGVLLFGQEPWLYAVSILLLQLSYLFDTFDGEVARVRGTASKRGTYLDLVGHIVQNSFLYSGVLYLVLAQLEPPVWLWCVLLPTLSLWHPIGVYASYAVAGGNSEIRAHQSRRVGESKPRSKSLAGVSIWIYRRIEFMWNYPASMNIFCVALAFQVVLESVRGRSTPVVAVVGLVFLLTLAVKQLASALLHLKDARWSEQ
jgi:phosphatidylglycerophosphate synthase